MAGTRTSPRQAAKADSSAADTSNDTADAGSKRKADSVAGSSPTNKRGRKETKVSQGQQLTRHIMVESPHDSANHST